MSDESTPSPLPVDVKPRHVLTGSTSTEFDLASLADARPRQVKVTRAFLLGAVLVSLAALVTFVIDVLTNHVPYQSDEFTALLQVNVNAYVYGVLSLDLYRRERRPPVSVTVMDDGLKFRFKTGATASLSWRGFAGYGLLYDRRNNPKLEPAAQLWLWPDSLLSMLRAFLFLPSPVPRTYLTPDAFDGIMEGAKRAGLIVTRWGNKFTFDQLNRMDNF